MSVKLLDAARKASEEGEEKQIVMIQYLCWKYNP